MQKFPTKKRNKPLIKGTGITKGNKLKKKGTGYVKREQAPTTTKNEY